MRQTGRTTRLLIRMAVYITEHWNDSKLIVFSADSTSYAWILAQKLNAFFDGSAQRNSDIFQFGKVRVLIVSHSQIKEKTFDEFFNDHYDRRWDGG